MPSSHWILYFLPLSFSLNSSPPFPWFKYHHLWLGLLQESPSCLLTTPDLAPIPRPAATRMNFANAKMIMSFPYLKPSMASNKCWNSPAPSGLISAHLYRVICHHSPHTSSAPQVPCTIPQMHRASSHFSVLLHDPPTTKMWLSHPSSFSQLLPALPKVSLKWPPSPRNPLSLIPTSSERRPCRDVSLSIAHSFKKWVLVPAVV